MEGKITPAKASEPVRAGFGSVAAGGLAAGIGGGILMAAWYVGWAIASGLGFWYPLRMIGATYYGLNALIGDYYFPLYGAALHLIASGWWGMLFALSVAWVARLRGRQIGFPTVAITALAYTIAIGCFMVFVMMPAANPTMWLRAGMMARWQVLVAHAIFAVAISLGPSLAPRVAKIADTIFHPAPFDMDALRRSLAKRHTAATRTARSNRQRVGKRISPKSSLES